MLTECYNETYIAYYSRDNCGIMLPWSCLNINRGKWVPPLSLNFSETPSDWLHSFVHHGAVFDSYSGVRGGFVRDYRVSLQKLPEKRDQIKAEAFRWDSQTMGGRGSAGRHWNQQETQRYCTVQPITLLIYCITVTIK